MAEKTYLQAISDSLRQEMRRDQRVFVLGEDVGVYGGAFKVTQGFQEEFGASRVVDMPLSETAIVAGATGAALMGMRPVAEMQFADFVSCAWDHLVTIAAKQHYRAGTPIPIVLRLPSGGGFSGGPFHSQNPESSFAHIPGLKIVCPATPEDAKGLLATAIEDPNPVLYFEHKHLYRRIRGEVPDDRYTTPFGKARLHRAGEDVTVITWGAMVYTADDAAEKLAEEGVSVEVLDLRTLIPWDRDSVLESVSRCSKALVLHEDTRTGGFGAEIAATIVEEAFEQLDAPGATARGAGQPRAVRPVAREGIHPAGGRRCGRAPRAGRLLGIQEADVSTGTQVEVVMPQMGVSVSEGTVTRWLKQPGESIELDEPLLEISTDKVDTEVPSPGEGVVTEIRVQEGETVEVGTVLAVIGAAAAAAAPDPAPAAPQVAEPEAAPAEEFAVDPTAPAPVPEPRRRSRLRPHLRPPRRQRLPARRPSPTGTDGPSSRPSSRGSPPSTASTRASSRDGPGRARHEEGHPGVHRVRRRSRACARRSGCGGSDAGGSRDAAVRRTAGASCRRAGPADRSCRPAACSPAARSSGASGAGRSCAGSGGGSGRRRRAGRGRERGADERDAARRRGAHAPVARHVRARDERDRGRHVARRRREGAPQEGVPGVVRRQPNVSRVRRRRPPSRRWPTGRGSTARCAATRSSRGRSSTSASPSRSRTARA